MPQDAPARRAPAAAGVLAVVTLAAAIVIGAVARWLVLRSSILNADEAYTGVEAFEILGGRTPIVLGGTWYTFPFESYVLAPVLAITGASITVLKALPAVWWVIAALMVRSTVTRLATARAGWLAAAFVWCTPGALLVLSVTAYESYSSGMLVTVLAASTAVCALDGARQRRSGGWRSLVLFGALCGLAFWMHPMFLSTVVPIALVVIVSLALDGRGAGRAGLQRAAVSVGLVLGGGVTGCAPFLAWNAVNGWPSLQPPVEVEGTYTDRLRTFVVHLLPRGLGLRDAQLAWELPRWFALPLYLAVLAGVVAGAALLLAAWRRAHRAALLVVPAALLGVLPIMAVFQNLIFAADGRYAVIAFPFLAMALAIAIDALVRRAVGRAAVPMLVAVAAAWVALLAVPTVRPVRHMPDPAPNAALTEVARRIRDAGFEHVYGTYWTVLPVDFAGDRHLTSAVLYPLPIRFPDRQRAVEGADHTRVAFVFGAGEDDPGLLWMPVDRYERTAIGGFVLYLPRVPASTT